LFPISWSLTVWRCATFPFDAPEAFGGESPRSIAAFPPGDA
jgi:hypothetical protein